MSISLRCLAVACLLPLALAACSTENDPPEDTGPDAGPVVDPSPEPTVATIVDCAGVTAVATVTASGASYTPSRSTISVGEVVKFDMPGAHDAKSGVPGAPDDTFRATFGAATCVRFDEAGTYPFFCEPHQFTGEIVVE